MSTDSPSKFSTLVDLMQYRSNSQPLLQGFIFLTDGESQENSLNYRELDTKAQSIAAHLQSLNMTRERALLLYPPGLEFIAAFLGCLYAGVIAVPAYPPRKGQSLLRVQSIAADAGARIVLTNQVLFNDIQSYQQQNLLSSEYIVKTESLSQELAANWKKPEINADTLAFLQYTSGSTGNPKGVMVSHGNLLHNSALICQHFGHSSQSQGMIWLPPYHDMGLIGGVIQPLYAGFPVVLMSPVMFVQKPLRWLSAISRYKATTSGGPNFAYEACLQKITAEQRKNLDLSSWEVAFCGAEPIRVDTLERFAEVFSECGFRKEAFYPCYGLAESTLFVSGTEKTAVPKVVNVESKALSENKIDIKENLSETTAIVSCGRVGAQEVVIVNPDNFNPCDENQVGEIWVTGESIARGYWGKLEETEEVFKGRIAGEAGEAGEAEGAGEAGEAEETPSLPPSLTPSLSPLGNFSPRREYLRTGDLGFIREGELYITGRIKDTIIIRGRNYYPQDIE
ncbi:MAG: fatty acyl-AMP ligase, partial [Cyanobacteria bacterium P01_D01_bin.116]